MVKLGALLSSFAIASVALAAPASKKDYIEENGVVKISSNLSPESSTISLVVDRMEKVISDDGELVGGHLVEVAIAVELGANRDLVVNGKAIPALPGLHVESVKASLFEILATKDRKAHTVDCSVEFYVSYAKHEGVEQLSFEARVIEIEDTRKFEADIVQSGFVIHADGTVSVIKATKLTVEKSHFEPSGEANSSEEPHGRPHGRHGKHHADKHHEHTDAHSGVMQSEPHHGHKRPIRCYIKKAFKTSVEFFFNLPFMLQALLAIMAGMCVGSLVVNLCKLCVPRRKVDYLVIEEDEDEKAEKKEAAPVDFVVA